LNSVGHYCAKVYPYLYLLLADSGQRNTFVEGSLSDFRLRLASAPREAIEIGHASTYQDRLSGVATPIISVGDKSISFNAVSNRLRGYVLAAVVIKSPEPIFEYKLELAGTMPLLRAPPDMFYVGFHDTAIDVNQETWETISNAVLIQHARKMTDVESQLYAYYEAARHVQALRGTEFQSLSSEEKAKALNARNRCGEGGKYRIRELAKPELTARLVDIVLGDHFGAVIKENDIPFTGPIPLEFWSPEMHLKLGGSTHNVYLDWYYYVGFWPLVCFLLFVILLTGALLALLWKCRRSAVFPFLLAVSLQVVVILGLMFIHPNLWARYSWFIFGVASGLLIHREFVRPPSGHLS
jgi:hypothetical protein